MYLPLELQNITESSISIMQHFIGLRTYSEIKYTIFVPVTDYCSTNNYKGLSVSLANILTCPLRLLYDGHSAITVT